MIIGLTTYTTRQHIARATLEATCFQTRAILDAMAKDTALSGKTGGNKAGETHLGEDDAPPGLQVLKVDGGMTGSDITMQLQADILGIEVWRPTMREWVFSRFHSSFKYELTILVYSIGRLLSVLLCSLVLLSVCSVGI